MSEAHISLTINSQKKLISAEIYITDDKELFGIFESNKDKIEDEIGFKLDWLLLPNGKASRIIVTHPGDLKSEVEWEEYFKWYIEKANKMKIQYSPKATK